jgi:uncharacterized protein YkwD
MATRIAFAAVVLVTANVFAADCGLGDVQREALAHINAVRAAGQRCGVRPMPPVPPLAWDVSLYAAAAAHSQDMATRNYLEHRTRDGRSVRDRVAAHHYSMRSLGENIAGGDTSVAQVMHSWLASTDHCENIMEAGFRDVGVACAQQRGTEYGTYWTMVLGRKR